MNFSYEIMKHIETKCFAYYDLYTYDFIDLFTIFIWYFMMIRTGIAYDSQGIAWMIEWEFSK